MPAIAWNARKNRELIARRGISFEVVALAIVSGRLLDDDAHPRQDRYPNQRVLVIEHLGYAWLVPYVETDDGVFLKTIVPSRKATRRYLGGVHEAAAV